MRRLLIVLSVLVLGYGILPASAVPVPVVASENIELLATFPDAGAISTAFSTDTPYMYVNTLNGITVYDISNPELPVPAGVLPMPHFENEGMTLGEREDGTKFLLVGTDVYAASPTDTDTPVAADNHFIIVDVTDPANPYIRGRKDTTTSTHTISCVGDGCSHAYTSGAYDSRFEIYELSDLDNPTKVGEVTSPVRGGGGSGHQWTPDDAGYMWVSGWGGTVAYDVSDPANPVAVASTDENGTKAPYNDFIQHNTYRPLGDAFTQERDATGRLNSGTPETASVFDGNVVLITEEDYDSPDCQGELGIDAPEGGFSTWHLPYMNAAQYEVDNPTAKANFGKITPLDTWNTELAASGTPTPAGALCSAHYFTFHQDGFVAQGWYQQGTRILDVRDPRDIKQVGYFFAGSSETWHAYWVPEYVDGKQTGKSSDVVYTNDVARGIDVLKVELPQTDPDGTVPLQAPILPQWLAAAVASSPPSDKLGYVCRLTTGIQ